MDQWDKLLKGEEGEPPPDSVAQRMIRPSAADMEPARQKVLDIKPKAAAAALGEAQVAQKVCSDSE